MNVLRLAALHLRRRSTAAIVLILSIATLLATAGALLTLQRAIPAGFERVDPAVDLVIGPKHSAWRLFEGGLQNGHWGRAIMRSQTALIAIDVGEPLRHVMQLARFAHADSIPVMGVDDAFFDRPSGMWRPELAEGRRARATGEAVLGARAARSNRLAIGDTLSLASDVNGHDGEPVWFGEVTVVGVLEHADTFLDAAALTTIDQARESYRAIIDEFQERVYMDDFLTHLLISVDDAVPAQRQWIYETFHTRRAEQVVDVAEVLEEWRTLTGLGGEFSRLLALLLLLMTFAVLTMVLRERMESSRRYAGLLRALGYSRIERFGTFFVEALILALLAIALSHLLERALLHLLADLVPGASAGLAVVTPPLVEHLILWAALLALVAATALLPALSADDESLLKGL